MRKYILVKAINSSPTRDGAGLGHCTADNKNELEEDLTEVWDKTLNLNDEPLTLSIFAQRHSDLLEKVYTILGGC